MNLNDYYAQQRKISNHPLSKHADITLASGDERSVKKAAKLIVDLLTSQQSLTRQDISKLRQAEQSAISAMRPNRFKLYQIYYDLEKDLHYIGCKNNRLLSVLQRNIKFVDDSGTENEDLSKLFRKSWFRKFRELVLEHPYHGHCLIELGDLVKDIDGLPKFVNTKIINHGFVYPEYGTVIQKAFDEPKNGINYRESPFSDWYIEVGEPDDFGLLLPLGFQILPKKNMMTFWDQFGEIFGMPIRIGKIQSRDQKDIDAMENVLKNMGAAAYGLFQEGTEIEIKESAKGDAFNVYDKRIDRADSEISKAVLGSTMTIDDGASNKQGEVHERTTEKIINADGDMELTVINESLLPVLEKHGFGTNGYHAEYDDTHVYTPKEMSDVEKMLLEHYEIDPEYFIEKYGTKITGVKQVAVPAVPPDPKKKSDVGTGHVLFAELHSQIKLLYTPCPHCGGIHSNLITLSKADDMQTESARIAQQIYDGTLPAGTVIDAALTEMVAKELRKAMIEGFGRDFDVIDFNTPDYEMLASLQEDVYYFSAAKNYHQLKEMKAALIDESGKVISFTKFRQSVDQINKVYNENYLQTEYNLAVNSSQQASRWSEYQSRKDVLPLLMYKTVEDSRVRASHRVLDGVIRKIDDPFWNTYFPPNGWNCRCTTMQLGDGTETDLSTQEKPQLDPIFRNNMAKDGIIFPDGHPYYKLGNDEKAVKKAGLSLINDK